MTEAAPRHKQKQEWQKRKLWKIFHERSSALTQEMARMTRERVVEKIP